MRRIVVTEFMSLDGVMEDPGGSEGTDFGGWVFKFQDPEGGKFKLDEILEHDTLLLGRKTYEGFAEAWPSRNDEAGFADRMNGMPKVVVSTTLGEAEWSNSTVIRENVVEEIRKLKEEPGNGKDILVAGSRQLVQTLMEHDLVDEYRLMVFPIVLGGGKRLFGDGGAPTTLTLTEARPLASGTVILVYGRAAGRGEA